MLTYMIDFLCKARQMGFGSLVASHVEQRKRLAEGGLNWLFTLIELDTADTQLFAASRFFIEQAVSQLAPIACEAAQGTHACIPMCVPSVWLYVCISVRMYFNQYGCMFGWLYRCMNTYLIVHRYICIFTFYP